MKIGGRKTRSVFERYATVSCTDIVDAMQKLQQARRALEVAATVAIRHETGHIAQQAAAQALPAFAANPLIRWSLLLLVPGGGIEPP